MSIDVTAVQAAFNRSASTYDEAAAMQWEVGKRLASRLDFIRLQPHRILDLGCSTGRFASVLQKRYPDAEIIGLDFAYQMLRHGQKTFDNSPLICADMTALPFGPGQFDLVFSNLSLQWIDNVPALMQAIKQVLCPDGLFLFTTLGPHSFQELRHAFATVDNAPHVNGFADMHNVGDALLQNQYGDPVTDQETLTYLYPSVMALMKELQQTGAVNQDNARRQSLTGKSRFKQMVQAYQQQWQRPDGLIPVSYEVIYGHAWNSEIKKRQANEPFHFSLDQMRAALREQG